MPPKKNRPRKKSAAARAQNAFAIAGAENPEKAVLARGRIGYDEEIESDGSGDGGNDSEGNEWKLGEVDSDDDSDIDSDEAMGDSDEERFADYTFRGSTAVEGKKKKSSSGGMDLEESDSEEEGDSEDEEDDGEGYIDLSEMLDRGTPENSDEENDGDSEEEKPRKTKKRSAPESDDEDGMKLLEEDDYSESEESDEESDEEMPFAQFSDEEDEVEEDPLKLAALQDTISGLPSSDRPNKRVRLDDPNEGNTPGEYNLALSSSSKKLSISDLLPSVTDATVRKSLKLLADDEKKDKSTKGGVPGKLSAPLAKRQQDRLDRAAAYVQTKDTLKRWVDTVKTNREAEHLSFPLANASNAPLPQQKKLIPMNPSESTPLNGFEATISDILKQSHMASEKQLAEFEELKTNKMSVEEVQARTAELRMARDLMYREELKAKRVKKIKSKSFRRIKKRERQKEQEAIDAALLEERGGEPDSDEDEERLRRRAEERMSLKHKQSRWAKGIKESGRGAWDTEARDGAVEMANRHEELRKRIQGKDMDSDATSDESESEDEFDEAGEADRRKTLAEIAKLDAEVEGKGRSKLMGMKFMQKAEAARKQENDAAVQSLKEDWDAGEKASDDSSDDEATTGRMSFRPQKPVQKVKPPKTTQEFEAPPGSSDEESEDEPEVELTNKATSTSAKKPNPFSAPAAHKPRSGISAPQPVVEEESNPWLPDANGNIARPKQRTLTTGKIESKSAKTNAKLKKDRRAAADKSRVEVEGDDANLLIDTNATLSVKKSRSKDDEGEDDDEAAVSLIPVSGGKAESQRELIKKAFAGDDVVRDFRKEKKKIMEEEDDQVVDDTLPGWGAWGGAGLSVRQKKFNKNRKKVTRVVEGVKVDMRKDKGMERVIMNEKRDKKATKFQAPHLPHPFETKQQYERSLRLPIGPEWTTKSTFQDATMPRVMVKQGRVVEPMAAPIK